MTLGQRSRWWPEPWLLPFCAFLALTPFEALFGASEVGWILNGLCLVAALPLALARIPKASPANARQLTAAGLVIALCLSYFSSVDPANTRSALIFAGDGWVLYLLATSSALGRRQLEAALGAWLLGACAATAVIVIQGLAGHLGDGDRPALVLGSLSTDPNYCAVGLLFPLAFALTLIERPRSRLVGGATALWLATGVAFTQSRGGLLGLSVAVLVTLAIRRRWKTAIGFVALGGAIAGFLAAASARFSFATDPTGAGRTEIWAVALRTGLAHLTSGVGLAALPVVTSATPGFWWDRDPHNTYVQAFAEAGLPGLLGLLAVIAAHLAAASGVSRRLPYALAGLAAVLTGAIFLHLILWKVFWVSLAVSAMACQSRQADAQPERVVPGQLSVAVGGTP